MKWKTGEVLSKLLKRRLEIAPMTVTMPNDYVKFSLRIERKEMHIQKNI